MTDQEINIAIAEVRGWEKHEKFHRWKDPTSEKFVCWKSLPDCCNDLNAMHEAEKTLDDNQLTEYCNRLRAPVSAVGITHPSKAITATARQRAEAFLRTFNLWKS